MFTSQLGDFVLPLPPLAEQPRIASEVERRLSTADEVEATIEAALTRADRLRQSILMRAFEGKLVPQDPNDEPASMLLGRIRRERTAAESSERPRRPRRRPASRPRRRSRT
jgi:type I restriction enzyme S subunit